MLLKEPLNPLLHTIISDLRAFFLLRRSFRLLCREYENVDGEEANEKRFLYVGEGESLSYLEELYFSGWRRKSSGTLSLLDLRRKMGDLVAKDCFLFVEIDRLLHFFLPLDLFQTFPWIRQKVFLKSPAYLQRKQKINSSFGRKVRKYGYTSRTTRDPGAVARFYRDFYVPYIRDRFQEQCFLRSLVEFQSAVESGFLLQVLDGGKWVSGAICQVRGKSITVLAFGVHKNHFDNLRHGVLSSAYYFIFLWAEKTGLETIDLLRSRAHAGDGVYEHKRRWGARAVKDPWLHTGIWIYAPDATKMPSLLGKQLIWRGDRFVELKSVCIPKEIHPITQAANN